jgi:hypothetical protein
MGLLKRRWDEEAAREWQVSDIPEDIEETSRLEEAVERRSRLLLQTRRFDRVAKPFVWECWDHAKNVAVSALRGTELDDLREAFTYDMRDDDAWAMLKVRARRAASAANLAGAVAQDAFHNARAALALETDDLVEQGQYVRVSMWEGFEADSAARLAMVLGGALVCIRGARACTFAFSESCGNGHSSRHAASVAVFAADSAFHAAGVTELVRMGSPSEAVGKCQQGLQDELHWQTEWLSERL